jgi:hypothetical protein
MKKTTTILMIWVVLAFWTYPGLAGNAVYYAPDGSKITKDEYDRLCSGRAEKVKKLKKAAPGTVAKKSRQTASAPRSAVTAVKPSKKQPPLRSGANALKINESDVRKITKDIFRWTNDQQAEKLIGYLAPSYKATLQTDEGEMTLTRNEYKDYLEGGWSGFGFYRAQSAGEKISISKDKQKATLETDVIEIATLTNGAGMKFRSHQIWTFEIVDGQILITDSQAKMEGL